MTKCRHLDQVITTHAKTKGCEECLRSGDQWVHLRLCLACGHVGCCDSSKNRHATKHFHATQHAVMQSLEPGEQWGWCYVDEVELENPAGAMRGRRENGGSPVRKSRRSRVRT